jgi:YfiH family protein
MDKIIEQSSAASGQSDLSDKTLAETGFYWRERDGVKVLICKPLEDAGFTNGFSTRLGGVSSFPENDLNLAGFSEDLSENIYENRRRFLNVFDGNYHLATVWQVHGDGVKVVNDDNVADSEERFDALTSNLEHVLVGVKTADCVPVLIGDPISRSFAAIHAGWRGTVQSIVVKAVEAMAKSFNAEPVDLVVAIGPAAGCENYEIGNDVIDAFEENFEGSEKYFRETRPGHALINLHLANKDQLISAGVQAANIFTAPFCTMERPDLFFSYRLEKSRYGKTGRLMSVIGSNAEART